MKLSIKSLTSLLIIVFFAMCARAETSDVNFYGAEASVTVPISPQEAAVGVNDPYGEEFDKFIFEKYPELKKVKFIPDDEMNSDTETLEAYKSDFYRGLFFAKQIKLADGRMLFDLVAKCGGNLQAPSGAQRSADGSTYFSIQFFPTFKALGKKGSFEEQILLERVGDQIKARSPLFSSAILTKADYMKIFGVECYK